MQIGPAPGGGRGRQPRRRDRDPRTSGEAGAFASAGDPLLASRRAGEPDLFASRPATGGHEVIVNAPEHVTAMAELSEERFAGAVDDLARADARPLRGLLRAADPQRGRRRGRLAASTPTRSSTRCPSCRPRSHASASASAPTANAPRGGGLLSDVLVEEVRRRERLVAIDDEAALICPWASRSPFELRVAPRREAARFEEDETGAAMIRTALRALAERFGSPPELNLWVRTAPRGAEHFHWHVDIAPRLTVKAGFELGTGVDINTYPPERAAADLREAL